MCGICEKRRGEFTVTVNFLGQGIQFQICAICMAISKEYYFAICTNCRQKSWVLASEVKTEGGSVKGQRFTVLQVNECLSCEGHNFKKA